MIYRENIHERDAKRELKFWCDSVTYSDGCWFVTGSNQGDTIWNGDVFTAIYHLTTSEAQPYSSSKNDWVEWCRSLTKEDLHEAFLQVVDCSMWYGAEGFVKSGSTGKLILTGEGGERLRHSEWISTLEIVTESES